MSTQPSPTLLDSILILLTESYAGPPDPSNTWFIDNLANSGVLGVLSDVTADEASRSVDGSGKPGTTIASHAEHLRWSLAASNAELRNLPFDEDWDVSWQLTRVDTIQWDRLRIALRKQYEDLYYCLIQF
jgi:hypothetical protein